MTDIQIYDETIPDEAAYLYPATASFDEQRRACIFQYLVEHGVTGKSLIEQGTAIEAWLKGEQPRGKLVAITK